MTLQTPTREHCLQALFEKIPETVGVNAKGTLEISVGNAVGVYQLASRKFTQCNDPTAVISKLVQ